VSVVAGATMSPWLSCLLAAHGATLLDRVDEVHVARHGVAGPACARQRLRALRGTALDWRDGEWVRRPGFSGRELNWFPDPIGGRDCYRAELAEPLLLRPVLPDAQRVTARLTASRRDRALAPFPVLLPPPVEGGLGAIQRSQQERLQRLLRWSCRRVVCGRGSAGWRRPGDIWSCCRSWHAAACVRPCSRARRV
jgi:hypothetical protein